jgi:hypothetical protein
MEGSRSEEGRKSLKALHINWNEKAKIKCMWIPEEKADLQMKTEET